MNVKLSLFLYAYKLFIPKCLPLDSVRLLLFYRLRIPTKSTINAKAID